MLATLSPQEDGRKNEGMADYYYKMAIKTDSSHGEALSSYARFLHEKKKDFPGALKHFKMVGSTLLFFSSVCRFRVQDLGWWAAPYSSFLLFAGLGFRI